MTTLIGASEAAGTLGVTKATLYAYVSRGIVGRRLAVDGRTSLYDRDELEALASRRRRRGPVERPSIDVRIATSITELHDDSPIIRGRRLLDVVEELTFEAMVELLLTGDPSVDESDWVDRFGDAGRCRAVVNAADGVDPIPALALAAVALSAGSAGDVTTAELARRLVAVSPTVLGGPSDGPIAERLVRAWVERPQPELIGAVDRALVLLADHELATSTLAVRVAASAHTSPSLAIATGLSAVAGRLHGTASQASVDLFAQAARIGADEAIGLRLAAGERLPGFGHSVYRDGDPRFRPLLDAVRTIPGARLDTVDDVIEAAGRTIGHLPNVDLALAALVYVGGLPHDAPLFAVARIPGWAAHYDEELGERPLRFRGLARPR